ncbi:hypothetical protein EG329_009902 [Mollisiaceae sp. DMI_Dod_QoI]|nr:hypothetical protein EG329_009902 [Helotiales sp. DMI_Dod_QoI]
MAGVDSSDDDGLQHVLRAPASQTIPQRERMLFLHRPKIRCQLEKLNHWRNSVFTSKKRHRSQRSKCSSRASTVSLTDTMTVAHQNDSRVIEEDITASTKRNSLNLPNMLKEDSRMTPDIPLNGASTTATSLENKLEGDDFLLSSRNSAAILTTHMDQHDTLLPLPLTQHSRSNDLLGKKQDWGKLRSLRVKVRRSRSRLQKKRKLLREKKFEKELAEEAFMKFTRETRPLSSVMTDEQLESALDKYYSAMQNARDEYGPLEDEFVKMEDLLDAIEYEMTKLEGQLYSAIPDAPSESLNATPEPLIPSGGVASVSTPDPLLGLVAGIQGNFQPTHVKYLTRLGDLDLTKERYDNLVQEREGLLSEQASRFRVGLQLHEDWKSVLEKFPAEEAILRQEMAKIEEDVELLRKQCIDEGIEIEENDYGSGYSHSLFDDDLQQSLQHDEEQGQDLELELEFSGGIRD